MRRCSGWDTREHGEHEARLGARFDAAALKYGRDFIFTSEL